MTTVKTATKTQSIFDGKISIPEHVSTERVVDFDFYEGEELKRRPHESFVRLARSAPDVFYSPFNGGHWVVTRLNDAMELLQNSEVFSNNPAVSGEQMRVASFERIPIDI